MRQLSSIHAVVAHNVVVNKPVLVKKEEIKNAEEHGAYGDYWGCDELAYPQLSLGTKTTSRNSIKSEPSYTGYGSFWGLDQE